MEATIYILRCADGAYYTGLTKQPVEARLWEHNEGIFDGYTKPRRPVVLVFTETYDRLLDAISRERQIKGWSRAKKEALIAGHYHRLPALSRNRRGEDTRRTLPVEPVQLIHPHGEPNRGPLILSRELAERVEGEGEGSSATPSAPRPSTGSG